jgi:hypothetical protein
MNPGKKGGGKIITGTLPKVRIYGIVVQVNTKGKSSLYKHEFANVGMDG